MAWNNCAAVSENNSQSFFLIHAIVALVLAEPRIILLAILENLDH